MKARPICHPDFAECVPSNVFHKEHAEFTPEPHPGSLMNRHTLFRRKFSIGPFTKAVLRITADDYYKLWINGEFVTQGPAPGYPWAYYYNEIDVTPYLRAGENLIAVQQYYQGLVNRVWVSADLRSMLCAELEIDGETVLTTDPTWKCAAHTGYRACGKVGYDTAFMEEYDSRAAEVGFESPSFDDGAWQAAAVYCHGDYTFVKQPTSQLVFEEVRPVKTESIDGGIRVDFGQEAAGTLRLTARGNSGDCVILRYGEELNPDGSVRYEMRCNCKYEERWILSGGTDTAAHFDYKAFRYAEILYPDTVTPGEITMQVRHYPFVCRASYPDYGKEFAEIIELCRNTIKYGVQECYVDCPTREKGQYAGDVSIAGRAHAILTGDTAMMKKAIREFCASSRICEGLMAVSGGALMQEIADYSLQLPGQVRFVYELDGDREFVRETEPYMTGILRHFSRYMREDGLLDGVTDKWNLVDWPANLRDGYDFPLTKPIGPGVHNVLNAFWCGFLDDMDALYGILGQPKTGLTAKIKAAFIESFWSEEMGLFCDSETLTHAALHSNVLPLLFDIGTENETRKRNLIAFLREKRLTAVGVYMAYFALAALMKHSERELALELTLDEGCWRNMLREGATTAYEAWGRDQKWNTSLFHPWAVAPAVVFASQT